MRLQLSRIREVKSLNWRAGRPLCRLSFRGRSFDRNGVDQAFVPRHIEYIFDRMGFTRRYRSFAGATSVSRQRDFGVRLLRPDQCHDAGNLRNAAGGCIDVRRTQLGRRQITAADDVQRQIAEAIVVVWKSRPSWRP
jgi:hypothetical protein